MPHSNKLLFVILIAISAVFARITIAPEEDYSIGIGVTDVTGPAAEAEMFGYAHLGQFTHGVHMRLFCRTFILHHKQSNTRMVYISVDLLAAQSIRLQLVEDLRLYHPELYALYNLDNIILGPTHTHSGPGGYAMETLYSISTLGFNRKHFNMLVAQITNSLILAHKNMSAGGRILMNRGLLFKSSINRSPTSYLLNPAEERQMYAEQGDTDKVMTVLRLENENGKEIGMLNWFAVHPVTLNNTNTLISSDNKGYAEYLFEKLKNGAEWLPGQPGFVAAFGQSNEGDSSPNTAGTFCPNGKPCEPVHSTCDGKVEGCIGRGPDPNEFISMKMIGKMQFDKALELYNNATRVLSGPIRFRHTFINMTNYSVDAKYTGNGQPGQTCQAALGYSFAAGTTDGVGWHFIQGDNSTGNLFWNFVSSFIAKPTPEQIKCQHPKPILIDVGLTKPYAWVPSILPFQLFTIGKDLTIITEPGEMTTMAGRRLKRIVLDRLVQLGAATPDTFAVISGVANCYCQYVTTYQEYQAQRYEAASTLFGPHTHAAYLQIFDQLATALAKNEPVPKGPTPRNESSSQLSFMPGVVLDAHPIGKPYGTVDTQVRLTYRVGDTVSVSFWGAHLANNYMTGSTFMTVEKQVAGNQWKVVLTDSDFCTKLFWKRVGIAESLVTATWNIEAGTSAGTYRIRHFGNSKDLFGNITPTLAHLVSLLLPCNIRLQ